MKWDAFCNLAAVTREQVEAVTILDIHDQVVNWTPEEPRLDWQQLMSRIHELFPEIKELAAALRDAYDGPNVGPIRGPLERIRALPKLPLIACWCVLTCGGVGDAPFCMFVYDALAMDVVAACNSSFGTR